MGPVAHVLQSPAVPGYVPWLLAAVLFGGLVTGLLARRRRLRLPAIAVALGAGAAMVLSDALAPAAPVAPLSGIELVAPGASRVTSPVLVRVCASPRTVGPTDGGRQIVVAVDGVSAGDQRSPTFSLSMGRGGHRLRVELVDGSHRGFQPALTAEVSFEVDGEGPLPAPPPCPAG